MKLKPHAKKILGDGFIYSISGIITSIIGIFLIPLYTRVFDPSQYGIIALLTSLQSVLSILVIFGLDNSFSLWYWEHPSVEERKSSVSNWFFFSLCLGFLIAIILALCSYPFAKYVLDNSSLYQLVVLLAINIFLASTQKIVNMWFRVRLMPLYAIGYSLVVSLLTVCLNIYFVLFKKIGLSGIYYSGCITSFVALVILIVILRKYISLKSIRIPELKKMLRFSFPLVPTGFIFWIMGAASPYFLALLLHNKTEIGLYQIGYTLSNVLALGTFAFLQAFTSYALSISKERNAREVYATILHYYIYIGFGLVLITGVLSKWILLTFTNVLYIDAYKILGILAFNVIFTGITQIVCIANLLAKDNKPIAISAMFSAFVTVIGFFILIPLLGKEGAALSVLSGNIVNAIFITLKAQKLYHIPYNIPKLISFIFIIGCAYILYIIV